MRTSKRIGALALVMAAALVVPACSAGGQAKAPAAADGMIAQLNYGGFGGGSNPQRNFNPFSPNKLDSGYMFEPLMVINGRTCDPVPWLAIAYRFDTPTSLTFTLRQGVKWSDGQPFGPADVAYTLNLLKKTPALDTAGIGSYMSGVTTGADSVTVALTEPYAPLFDKIAATVIVPEHVWGKVADPQTFTNDEAIGTGPFTVEKMDRQQLLLKRNPGYWQADKIKVERLGFTNNEGGGPVDQLKLARGEYDTNSMFVPDIQKTYVAKDPEHNKYWFPPGDTISLYLNLTKAPFDDLAFRKAISVAIDRQTIRDKAQFGYVETASQTGLRLPGQESWLEPGLRDGGKLPFDTAAADQQLTAAGYARGADGVRTGKDGKPLTFTFQVPSGYTDWIQSAQIIQGNLRALGITVDVQSPAPENVESARARGEYDIVFGVHGKACDMYENFAGHLSSAMSAPVGQKAVSNFVRWNDRRTDSVLTQLRATTDEAAQKPLVTALQQVMVEQLPVIPLWYGGKWFEYSTRNAVGWPNAEDPYALPSDNLLIITKLRPAG